MENVTLKNLTLLEKENIKCGLVCRLDALLKLYEERQVAGELTRYDVLACINILKLLGYENWAKGYTEDFAEIFN